MGETGSSGEELEEEPCRGVETLEGGGSVTLPEEEEETAAFLGGAETEEQDEDEFLRAGPEYGFGEEV